LCREGFKGHGIAVLALADNDRDSAHLIACRDQVTVAL
jgi:hypothetical protein